MATYRLWPATDGPATATIDDTAYTLGVEFEVTSPVNFTAWNWWCQTSATVSFGLYRVTSDTTGALLASRADVSVAAGGWRRTEASAPIALVPGERYRAVVFSTFDNFYTATSQYWLGGGPGATGLTNGPLRAFSTAEATSSDQGSFISGASMAFPNNAFNGANYWIDPEVADAEPSTNAVTLQAAVRRPTMQTSVALTNPVALAAAVRRAVSSLSAAGINSATLAPPVRRPSSSIALEQRNPVELQAWYPRPLASLSTVAVVPVRDIHVNALALNASWLPSVTASTWSVGGTITANPTGARALAESWLPSQVEAPSKLSAKPLAPAPLKASEMTPHPLTAGKIEV